MFYCVPDLPVAALADVLWTLCPQQVTTQAAWHSALAIASGRLFAGRPPAWTPPRRPPRRSPGAKRPLRRGFNRTPEQLRTFQRSTFQPSTFPRSTLNVRNYSAAWRSAIEIASGRLFAGRPPAWTLPRRPPRRSPGAKRPLRRGFNRTPEQLRTFNLQRATFLPPVKSLMPCDTNQGLISCAIMAYK